MTGHPFTDPSSGAACELAVPDGGAVHPGPGQPRIGIAHPGCDALGDLVLDLDAWQCRTCGVIGRVSGAWAADTIRGGVLWAAGTGRPSGGRSS